MELIRVYNKKSGIRYITPDVKYRIRKFYRKADWELSEITGHGCKIIKYFKYFKDAKQYLKEMLGE